MEYMVLYMLLNKFFRHLMLYYMCIDNKFHRQNTSIFMEMCRYKTQMNGNVGIHFCFQIPIGKTNAEILKQKNKKYNGHQCLERERAHV